MMSYDVDIQIDRASDTKHQKT